MTTAERLVKDADAYAAEFATSLDVYAAMRPRSRQQTLGVSSVGHCAAEATYILAGVAPTDAPIARQALMGTAIHEMVAAARLAYNPDLLIEVPLTITLPSGVVITGKADEIDPGEPSVTDAKTVADGAAMAAQRRTGSTEQQRFQRHLYYYGAMQAGLVPGRGIVRNVWLDRSGQCAEALVEQEPFDMAVIHDADRWLADVRYAAEHGEEAPKEKYFSWCRSFCQHFTHCRSGQGAQEYVITDPELVAAARLVHEGRAEGKEAAGMEATGRRVLEVLQRDERGDVASYVAGDYRVRWTLVQTAKPYYKLDVELQDGH